MPNLNAITSTSGKSASAAPTAIANAGRADPSRRPLARPTAMCPMLAMTEIRADAPNLPVYP
jgi:hypothetical protein